MTKLYKPPMTSQPMSPKSISLKPRRESGFTLIEVMVALAILAVVAVAASRASSAYLSSVDILRTRTLAHFVAQNAAADWQISMTVGDAITPALKEVNIAVSPIIDGQTRTSVTDITVMLSNTEQDTGSLDLSGLSTTGNSEKAGGGL